MKPVLHISACLVFAAMIASAFTQEQTEERATEPLTTVAYKCWKSGSGATYFEACASKHGNIVTLKSPAGSEVIRVGEVAEGYVACSSDSPGAPPQVYYDAGAVEAGWAEPYKITTAGGLGIYRKTLDQKLELVQSIIVDPAERDITVIMTLFNRSGRTLYDIRLDRYADWDIDNNVTSDIFHTSPRAVFGWDASTNTNFVSMTDTIAGTPVYTTAIHPFTQWQRAVCNQPGTTSPTGQGDWVARISYLFGTLNNGAQKTTRLVYRLQ